jgi:predicted nucleotidyltransferase
MNLQRPLQVVAPTLDGDVLSVLARADRVLTGRALERETGGSHGGVQRALDHLVAEGVVSRQPAGRAYLYRLNREHLAAPWIQGLATLRLQLIDRLRSSIASWEIQPTSSVLFGSAARGEAGRASDLDVLMIRPAGIGADDETWREQVMALQEAVAAWTGNDLRVLEYGEQELGLDEPVLATAGAEGIELHGSLRRLLAHERRQRR